ncbi:hypothetical protein HY639_04120 [Candidatus Woesearchaeota archaeon]|nr:hypothetical protein [Candidatus Woesearchaeota archaeon]
MGENIAVLLVFTVLLVLGIIFYVQYKRGTVSEEVREQRIKSAIETAQRIAYLPEVQCSEDGIQRENCYDKAKIEAASDVMKNDKNFYYSILGYSTVEIELVYPPPQTKVKLYENIKPGTVSKEMTQAPIAVYVPEEDRYVFGVLKVTVYG